MSTLAASRRSATELLVTTLTDGVQKFLATRRQGRGPPRHPSPLTTESSTLRKLATFAADQQDAKLLYHQSGAAKLESWMRMAASRRRSAAGGHKLAGGEGSSRPCWKGDCRQSAGLDGGASSAFKILLIFWRCVRTRAHFALPKLYHTSPGPARRGSFGYKILC